MPMASCLQSAVLPLDDLRDADASPCAAWWAAHAEWKGRVHGTSMWKRALFSGRPSEIQSASSGAGWDRLVVVVMVTAYAP